MEGKLKGDLICVRIAKQGDFGGLLTTYGQPYYHVSWQYSMLVGMIFDTSSWDLETCRDKHGFALSRGLGDSKIVSGGV